MVGAEIHSVDSAGELTEELGIHRRVLLRRDFAACEAALVGDDHREPTGVAEALERANGSGKNPHALGVVAVVHLLHQRAVAIEEHRAAVTHGC
jgi:hypothetical protein